MKDISEYINSELSEDSARLGITDQTSASHSCSVDGLLDGGTAASERQLINSQQSVAIQSTQGWTDRSPTREIHFSRFLSMRLKPIRAGNKKGRLNIKKDLTPEEIGIVASGLITDGSIPFFLNHYGPICDIWKSLLSARARARSTADSVTIAFDLLYSLLGVGRAELLRRFAYVQLADAIDALADAVSLEREAGRVHRERGYRNESIYIDVYLTAKGQPVDDRKLRNELSGRKRIGVRSVLGTILERPLLYCQDFEIPILYCEFWCILQ